MFKFEQPKVIKWPATISIPRDGGNTTKATLTAHFKPITQKEQNAIYDNGGTDEDLLRAVMVGWADNVCDSDGNPMEFNEENVEKLIAIPYVRSGLIAAYMEVSLGKEAKRKN